MFENVKADIKAFNDHYGSGALKYFYYPMFSATMMIRLSRWLYLHKLKIFAYLIVRLNDFLHGIWVGPNVEIGPGLFLAHSRGLIINPDTKIGSRCVLLQNVTLGGPKIVIGDNVTIGAGALIIASIKRKNGCRIGNNVTIGAGAVVTKDVPDGAIMVGNPAKNIAIDKNQIC